MRHIGIVRLHTARAELATLDRMLARSRTISSTSGPIVARARRWRAGRRRCASSPAPGRPAGTPDRCAQCRALRRCAPSCCPAVSPAAAHLHLARTVCRRAERADGGACQGRRARTCRRRRCAMPTGCRTSCSSRRASSMTSGARRAVGACANRAIRAEPRCSFRCMTTPRCDHPVPAWSTVR